MRRRDFIVLLGGAMAWPLAARAQQTGMPVIGFVRSGNPNVEIMNAFQRGLKDGGYVEGQNIAIEHRSAVGQYERLPELLADLIRRQVSLIVASGGLVSAKAAKAATDTIPIIFIAGFDPVQVGLVTSLNRPGGNATGVSVYTTELSEKRLELLHKLVPKATTIALLTNPRTITPKVEIERTEGAARHLGLRLLVLEASVESDFEPVFAQAVQQQAEAFVVSADAFFTTQRAQIVALASRYGLPAAYPWPEYVEAGGLMSYGPTLKWAYQEVGHYASRILKGAKPSDLAVQLPTRFEWSSTSRPRRRWASLFRAHYSRPPPN